MDGEGMLSFDVKCRFGRIVTARDGYTCQEREAHWSTLKALGDGLHDSVVEWVAKSAPCLWMRGEAGSMLAERLQARQDSGLKVAVA